MDSLSIQQKVQRARLLCQVWSKRLLQENSIRTLLETLQQNLHASRQTMRQVGLVEICKRCEELEGGSCCGKGIENRYNEILLLINLLLGCQLSDEQHRADSCFFLGPRGCTLLARHVLCVNYLCQAARQELSAQALHSLQHSAGVELETTFLLHEKIKEYIRRSQLAQTIATITDFYNARKYGYEGFEGYRKSTDLTKLTSCVRALQSQGLLEAQRTVFLDLGCADGRVNILLSYFVKYSLGIEIDGEILAEADGRLAKLQARLEDAFLLPVPGNVTLLSGDSLQSEPYVEFKKKLGVHFSDVDVFYTYITLHDLFAAKIAREAKAGALYLVYGFNKVLPQYEGLQLIDPDLAGQGIVALYRKRLS
ncbi:MAG: hypothetical protein JRJ12_04545 [Deltaproteobacteria bacterium]|nr:hypothetical protein [Deltaproteobacteria bacterium]MBW2070474.1 hypothetical protein [Deltaproteobacteria bacterium]